MIPGGLGFIGSIGFLFSRANKKDREKLLKDYIIKDMLEHNFLEAGSSDEYLFLIMSEKMVRTAIRTMLRKVKDIV